MIFANPGFLPQPPEVPSRSSTPAALLAGSPLVGSWDGFFEEPTYRHPDEQFWTSRKIQLVSTDVSDLEELGSPDSSSSVIRTLNTGRIEQSSTLVQNTVIFKSDKMSVKQQAISALKQLEIDINDMCEDLNPDLVTLEVAPSMDNELEKINKLKTKYRSSVRDILSKFDEELSLIEKEKLKADMKKLVDTVIAHKFSVLAKVNKLLPPTNPMSQFEKATMEMQQKQLDLQQKQLDMQAEAADSRKKEAHALARPLKKLIIEKCGELDDELEQISVTGLPTVDDQTVTRTMLKLSSWQSKLESIVSINKDFSEKTAVYPLPEEEHSELTSALESTKASFVNLKTTVEEEDIRRQLYSLDITTRVDQVKWPTFAGDAGEDFIKFKADFLDACRQNKTTLRNQITKLRENVKGYARSLIPASLTDLEKAWKILERACGDSLRVVNHRIENLMNVGAWPQDGTRDCFTKQVKWIVKVQGLLQEIIDLASTNEEISAVIYNRSQIANILKLFPMFMMDKLAELPGYKEDKYKLIIEKLDKWKNVSLNRESILGQSTQQKVSSSAPKPDRNSGNSLGHVNFPKPKKLLSCRVCKVLESQGNASNLYEGHVSDFATGCPKFAGLGTDQRMVVAREAKFCLNCMGKETRFSLAHLKECPIKKKKSIYSCRKDSCLLHMWLCKKHYTTNKEHMEKFSDQLQSKSGIQLVFMSLQKKDFSSLELPVLNLTEPSQNSTDLPTVQTSPLAYCTSGDNGIKQAVRKLHRLNKKKDPDAVTISPPTGLPLFLFQPIEGFLE